MALKPSTTFTSAAAVVIPAAEVESATTTVPAPIWESWTRPSPTVRRPTLTHCAGRSFFFSIVTDNSAVVSIFTWYSTFEKMSSENL